jgi:4-coumarate--CoA ligase
MPRYDRKVFIDTVEKYQVTEVLLVPPMVLSLPLAPKCIRSALASLRQIFCGGAAVPYHVQKKLYDVLHPDARINQVFGMTECGWVCASQYPERDETSSVGRPLGGFFVK